MTITVTQEHYRSLYKEKFSSRGYALLQDKKLTEEKKAAFCADIFERFNPDAAIDDDFKDMFLALKLILDKNISNGKFLAPYWKPFESFTVQSSHLFKRRESLSQDDLDNPHFVSSMVLLYVGREMDFYNLAQAFEKSVKEKIEHGQGSEKEKLTYHAIGCIAGLLNIYNVRFPPPNNPKISEAEFNQHLSVFKEEFKKSFDQIKAFFNKSFDFDLNEMANVSKPTRVRAFFVKICSRIAHFLKPANPESFFGKILNYLSTTFQSWANTLYVTHLSNYFSSNKVSIKKEVGLLDAEVIELPVKQVDKPVEVELKKAEDSVLEYNQAYRPISPKDPSADSSFRIMPPEEDGERNKIVKK